MLTRQCLACFGPEHRCVMQEEHRGWHGDNAGTIWFNDEPGALARVTPFEAEYANVIARVLAPWEPPPKKKKPRQVPRPALTRKIPERAQGVALERRRREGVEAAVALLRPGLRAIPVERPKSDEVPASHHLAHPGAWMLQGHPQAWADDYDPLLEAVHDDLLAIGIL